MTKNEKGMIKEYFLWRNMTADQSRKISHFQTLKYPKASEEGQVFTSLKHNPEIINTFKRNYKTLTESEVTATPIISN